jgi:hypothetical protein
MKLFVLSGMAAMALAWASGASAQQTDMRQSFGSDPPSIVMADTVTTKATVIVLDRDTRRITLQEEDGDEHAMVAGPEIRNFDQIEVGDTVTTEYSVEIRVHVRKPGEPPAGAASSLEAAPLGQKPGGRMTERTEIIATIDDIDYAQRTVTLRNPEGKTRLIVVNDRVKDLDRFKKGDEIAIRHTEVLAISVTK